MQAYLEGSWVLFWSTFLLGSLIGSFVNVVIARLPVNANIAWPPSHCPKCKTPIRPHQNIPILSWLALRGKCAWCKAPISLRYPVVELITAFLFATCASRFGWSAGLLAGMGFSATMVAITFIDIDTWEIPDEIVLWGLPLVICIRPLIFQTSWWSGILGAVAGATILLLIRWVFFALRGIEAMGLGDVKLLAFIGGFLGIGSLIPTLTLASLAGALTGIVLLLAYKTPPDEDSGAQASSPETQEAWEMPPKVFRLGLILRVFGQRWCLGLPKSMRGRTHMRIGWLMGIRTSKGRSGLEVGFGLYQDIKGWGHFEGLTFGEPVRLWIGPVIGARLADVEAYGDEEPWEPPPTALPFGPFLAMGALATMFFAPLLGQAFRWIHI